MTYRYTHRLAHPQRSVWLTPGPQLIKMWKIRDCAIHILQWDMYHTLFFPVCRHQCRRGNRKDCKSQKQWLTTGKHYFLYTTGHLHIWTHSTCDSMHKTCATQVRPNPTTERGGGHKIPTIAEELLATDRCQERKSSFSLRVWPPIGKPYSGEYRHTLEHRGSPNWTCWILENLENHQVRWVER